MVRETRHLWVGNLPENVREEKIIEHFKRYGRVESVKVLPKRGSEGGVAAFVDFVDIKSAQKAHNSINKMGDRDLRTDYNEPGTIPSAARGLDDSLSIATRGRDVSGFTRGAGGPVYGPPVSLHSREGRFERRLDGAADGQERSYDHSAYGHHERSSSNSSSFDHQRHYETDYYRDSRDRALSGASGSASSASGSIGGGSSGAIVGVAGSVAGSTGAGGNTSSAAGVGSGSSTPGGIVYYGSRSRSPTRFETTETRYESRAREAFTLASVVHRELYIEERGRRVERTYHHSRSRSPHSSQSHNPSPQRLPSQAVRLARSRSGSGSRSRSSSSDSVSSTSGSGSSDSSSSSSDRSPARSVQSAAVPAPSAQPLPSLDKDEPRKSFGIKVQNLPVRSTDTSLKDGLFHEFKKHGKVTSVQIHGASEERYGLVFFRQQEDQEKALSASKGKLFFGMQIDVTAWHGPETESENEFRPLDERIDEFHPKATRTLFIGNLEKTTTYHDLLNIFQRFGEIVDIDIKKVNGSPQYAFLQYCDIASVCKAIKKMDGEYLGNNRLKLGFGKSMPTTCVWLDGLSSSITEQYLTRHFCRYGHVVKVVFDRLKGMALILYNNIEYAQAAVKETKGWKIGGNKIKVDFANQESQMTFYRSMQASGQDIRDFYEIINERRDERRPPYHEFTAERAYYENVRSPGSYTEDPRRKYPARSREFYSEWDPYQGDYYDPRYYDDPREYRDYRDPYEQDIRKYSYLQRERERERERFETDRERDHGRRTTEHNQSPSHPRRPASPAASPSLSEHPPSDSEHRVYSHSSERSGSCSSLSPPRLEKPDKIRLERHNRSDKSEKDKSIFEAERGNGGEKDRRAGRKEKGDKDRTEKPKLRKLKLASPTVPSSEPDIELDRDTSADAILTLRGKSSKSLNKDYSGKGKLDLPPCVVQLTRVKEKEGKLIDSILSEKQKTKVGSDPVRSPTTPPSADDKSMPFRIETQARDFFKHGKHLKEKGLASQVEVVDKEGKVKNKKYFKTDFAFDTSSSVDADRLAARKRRFEETSGKADNLRKISQEEDEVKLRTIIDESLLKDIDYDKKMQRKEAYKREKIKLERMITVNTTKEELDTVMSVGLSLDLQARLGEPTEEATDPLDSLDQKTSTVGAQSQPSFSLADSDDGSIDMEFSRDQEQQHLTSYHILSSRLERDPESKESLLSDIDHSQSCRKQMEQNRRLHQELLEYDKSDKTESTPSTGAEDFEHRSLVHEIGKPPQDVTGDSPPSKRKKSGPFELDFGTKRQRDYQRFRQINDEPERRLASLPGTPFAEDASQLLEKEPGSPVAMNKNCLHFDVSKYNIGNAVRQGLSSHAEILKVKTSVTEEEFCWESNIRQGTLRGEMSFPTSIVKRESIRKRPERELEPGEVQTDSDEDSESRHLSLKPNSFKREHEERLSDVKSSESLEKNKFYEFALDKTITPDTKALLERAKSLSSSREENWSFLGHDSQFKSFRNSTDKEKSEPTPRPIPSWYMKKKKIRSDSDGKLDDKKKDAKPDEQERQELFASRFLHSSIFEQDSRRLQHLEWKNNDPEVRVGRDSITSDSKGEQVGAGGSDLSQEPRVLFHSRFLELQQRDKNQQLPVSERFSLTEEEEEKTLDEEFGPSPNVSEISQELTVSHIPATTSPMSRSKVSETSVQHDKPVLPSNKDGPEIVTEQSEDAPVDSLPSISLKEENTAVIVSAMPTEPMIKEDVTVKELNEKLSESIRAVNPPVELDIDVKPLTPAASLSNIEPECDPFQGSSATFSKPCQPQEIGELSETKTEPVYASLHKVASPLDVELPETEPEVEQVHPLHKQPKSKKVKTASPTPIPQVANEKPATRKSERIDKEKLKRSSSPRGDSTKLIADPKNSAKSPVHATDSDQGLESNTSHGKTRQRRNVRSVYATPHEDEASQQPGKEITEPPRSTRKRCSDKEAATQHMVTTPGKRGRPPKTRKRGDDMSPVKGDQTKNSESEDTENKESTSSGEISKTAETWRSPRSQKGQSSPIRAGQIRKTLKLDKVSSSPEPIQSDTAAVDVSPALDHQNESKDETSMQVGQLSQDTKQHNISKREKGLAHPAEEKSTDNNIEITSVEKTQALDQKKVKASRSTRNTKLIPDDKSVNVGNLTVDTVKDALHSGDNKVVSLEGSLKTKTTQIVNEDSTIPIYHNEEDVHSPEEKEGTLSEMEPPTDPVAALLARQMELERAVENISRLTDEQHPAPYKEPRAEPATLTSPVIVQRADDAEVEKPANPASETELAAAMIVALSTPGVGGPPANPPMPPDTKASDIDPSSSTLRKILMEPKYVSASNSNAVPSMQFTTTLADPRMSGNKNSVEAVLPLKTSLPEDRPSPVTQLVPRTAPTQPPTLQQCESPQILKEKLAITSTATSVISRIPMPFDFEDTPHISLSNRSPGMSLPKQKYRTGLNENSRYQGLNPSDDAGSVGRPVVESTHCNTGSSTGLRVNTSEGVVVLSYSGQKTEGPQRIIAKISQIPPASAMDIEFQQSVTKSQIKQEPPSHPSTPKGSQTPTGYGHAGVVLAGQTFSAQPVISSVNQESLSSEKSEPSYHTALQAGSVKTFQQSTSHPQLLRYGQSITQQQHIKKNGATETVSMKAEIKPSSFFYVKTVLSPHHPSLAGNHILSPSTAHERVVSQPKQDSHSPRASGHSTSPFPKICPPTSLVVLGPAGPISQYVSNKHHAEQSVIMPPHSVTQSVPIGHLSQGDVRASTPSLSGIGYGIRSENLLSPRSAPPQRSMTPQPAVIRDVLKSHASSSVDGQVVGTSNDDLQSLPQGLRRASAPQLQPESIVMQPEFKGLHHRALCLDQYARDVHLLVHQHLTDHPGVVESHQTRTPEAMQSPSHISSTTSKVSPVVKNAPQTVRDAPKAMELKMPPSPHSDNRIIGHPPGSVMVSPQGVQLIHSGNANSMSEYYREMRGFHPQYPSHSVIGINLANRGIAASQVSQIDHGQRHKVPSVSSIESVGSYGESKLDGSHIRHPSSMDLSHISRVQGETGSPSYTSPVTITPKLELPISVQKGPNQMPPPSSASSQMRSDFKLDRTGLRSVDMVQLLTKYPIIWQGHLALKNDTAAVQLHFVSGNSVLAHRSLPPPEGGAFLRIAQRMRLEASQLEGVARRMTAENEYCLLLALPCGLDQEDVHNQTHALKTGFITYLQAKQAAGIINVPNPGSNQPAYVVQIFPPCEFSESHLSHLAPDLLNSISSISPHLMIVIASV
ncbi:LOW QUALITY PROTEIN: msx2-interacting protein-like [Sinocyclocheilus anshuiensis]|uniref:LOW QUALITY PROTEIN: msx2-interacting protein-like n=1 Tax=Sinocyclocheilus anshuiensis TaxID=1608454 RepID=UPI0007BAD0B4|nr:PREDICTED: LOW QUALITY PROTEIN: msx2-interacting protein-like [Sinocyclocheilus anshuiensis]